MLSILHSTPKAKPQVGEIEKSPKAKPQVGEIEK